MRKLVLLMTLTFVLIGMLGVAFKVQRVEASGTVYIRADGSVDPPTAPISTVDNVTYTFTDNINESIVIERDNIVVDGEGYAVQGIGTGTGIYLNGRSHVTIKNMEIKVFEYGIHLSGSSNNTVSGNKITENKRYGIWLSGSSNNTVSGNNITNNNNGIVLYYSSNNFLQSNLLDGNQYGFGFLGLELSHFLHSIDTSNLVNGKPVYYLISKHDLSINPSTHPEVGFLALINSTNITVEGLTLTKNRLGLLIVYTNNTKIQNNNMTNNVRGIVLNNSSNNTLSGNNIIMNGAGIWLDDSSNNTVSGNNLIMNSDGIELSGSSNNTLSGNTIKTNFDGIKLYESSGNNIYGNNLAEHFVSGIWLSISSNNTLSRNKITENPKGIVLKESSNNRIYHNNLIDNTQQVYIETSGYANFWDDGYPSGGNYWSDYNGTDMNQDGIGDILYEINVNNKDNYPLIGMFSDFSVIHQEETYHVTTICNSTISAFQFNDVAKTISFNVTGPDYPLGICRATIPNIIVQDWWQGNYTVLVDGEEPIIMNNWTDGTYTYIYFTYQHSTRKVKIIPEFPTWTSTLLILIVPTIAIAIYKRRLPKTPIQ